MKISIKIIINYSPYLKPTTTRKNPDITNSEGNQKIICFIWSSLSREKTFSRSFRGSHLKILPWACLGCVQLPCTFNSKNQAEENLYAPLVIWDQETGKAGITSLLVVGVICVLVPYAKV